MPAGDVTVSLDAASLQGLVVHRLTREDRDQIPRKIAPDQQIAAAGNTVINLGPNDSLIVERVDTQKSITNDMSLKTDENLEQ